MRPARSFFPFLLSRAGEARDDNTRWGGHRSKGKADKFENLYCWVGGGAKRERRGPKKIPSPRPIDSLPPLKKVPSSAHCCCSLGGGMMSASRRANGQTTKFLFFSRFHLLGSFIINQKSVWVRRRGIMGRRAFVPEATYESIDVRSKCLSNHHARRRRRRGEGVTQKVFVAISLGRDSPI